jgi:4-alpha-glucanotransferase
MSGLDNAKKIALLGCMCGITSRYWDNFGRLHHTSPATYQALLSAMRVPWEDPVGLDREIARRRLRAWGALTAPVEVIAPAPAASQATMRLWSPIPEPSATVDVQAELVSENGDCYQWEKRLTLANPGEQRAVPGGFRCAAPLPLPAGLELGYYDLALTVAAAGRQETGQTRLIAAPPSAYAPEGLKEGDRLWGFNLPLYAIRSRTNWGMGDFADLRAIMRWAGDLGAAFVGVNPLHASNHLAGGDLSPYSPVSRVLRNILYLDLESVPEMADCREARDLMAGPEFQAAKSRLAAASQVPYREVYQLKQQVLRLLYETFRKMHGDPKAPRTHRGQEFARFAAAKGGTLVRFGQFSALAEHFQKGDWRHWPQAYQDPENPAVAEFARLHPQEVGLAQYGQWLAEAQQGEACRAARTHGLAFSLYEDLALGVNPGGFDTWAHQDLFALDAASGAPADAFNPKGQNWGLPPMIPERLRASGYRLFIDTLRANLPVGGMLRLDHVMGLFRLLWIPKGAEASQGAYVRYPERELLAILALESQRRRALIIGEDLGTVPPRIRQELARAGVFSYRVFYFERDENRHFLPPEAYPAQAMATATTHDLPTLAGFWQGTDLALKQKLNLYPGHHLAAEDTAARDEDRRFLLAALKRQRLLPVSMEPPPVNRAADTSTLREAVLTYLSGSRAALMEVRLEDIFGVAEQQNLPGTKDEHPNWRLKMPLTLEEMIHDPEPARLAARLHAARGKESNQ